MAVAEDQELVRSGFVALLDSAPDIEVAGQPILSDRYRETVARLTARERELLVEVAQGLSNAEIARSLHISLATTKTHVSHLLTKLDVRDRVQLTIVAYESGLVRPGAER